MKENTTKRMCTWSITGLVYSEAVYRCRIARKVPPYGIEVADIALKDGFTVTWPVVTGVDRETADGVMARLLLDMGIQRSRKGWFIGNESWPSKPTRVSHGGVVYTLRQDRRSYVM